MYKTFIPRAYIDIEIHHKFIPIYVPDEDGFILNDEYGISKVFFLGNKKEIEIKINKNVSKKINEILEDYLTSYEYNNYDNDEY